MPQDAAKILIIDDEPSLLEALAERLTQEGFITLEAKDGVEGIKTALEVHPDLILLDLMMPLMDGIEVLRKLRSDPWGEQANVLVLTNLNDEHTIHDALQTHTYEYLIKADWSLEDLVKKIKEKIVENQDA